MFSIGDFAKLGRVSVRMLRHYDAIGLLRPATVDAASSYRFYDADQLHRLNRVIALKDLGFTLEQVRTILDDKVDVVELRGMLRLRQAELEAQLSADTSRLAGVESRLRMIETEGRMTTQDVVVKEVPPVRVAELTGVAASYSSPDISPVIQPLYRELMQRLAKAGVAMSGHGVAYYETAEDESVIVHAGATVAADPHANHGFAIVDLPAVPAAATLIHRGSMDHVDQSFQTLAKWIDENGYRTDGNPREVYIDYDPDDAENGVTELQIPVAR